MFCVSFVLVDGPYLCYRSQVFGPILYGITYTAVVGKYPSAIFFVSAAAVTCATLALFFVELPRHSRTHDHV